jgi:hypothetical protein
VLPEYVSLRPDAWIRLLAHELAHCWMPDIRPAWLREGFAVVAADQGFGALVTVHDLDDALTPIAWGADRHAYARAAASLELVLQRIPIRELLEHADDPALDGWIRTRWANAVSAGARADRP